MGKSTISTGPFPIAMLNYQRVTKGFWPIYPYTSIYSISCWFHCHKWGHTGTLDTLTQAARVLHQNRFWLWMFIKICSIYIISLIPSPCWEDFEWTTTAWKQPARKRCESWSGTTPYIHDIHAEIVHHSSFNQRAVSKLLMQYAFAWGLLYT